MFQRKHDWLGWTKDQKNFQGAPCIYSNGQITAFYQRYSRSVTESNNVLSKISMGWFYFLKIMWSIIVVAVLRPGTWTLKMGALHCIRKPSDCSILFHYGLKKAIQFSPPEVVERQMCSTKFHFQLASRKFLGSFKLHTSTFVLVTNFTRSVFSRHLWMEFTRGSKDTER